MAYYNKYVQYPLNIINELGEFPWHVDLKQVEENFDDILNEYFKSENCFLNEREKRVILARHKDGKTLEEIGNEFSVTRERARQIERNAIYKLINRKEMFYYPFDSYIKDQELYNKKREELSLKIIELDNLIKQASILLDGDDMTIREIKEFLNTSVEERNFYVLRHGKIEDLDFSVRTINCLTRSKIRTVKQLSEKSVLELTKIRNLGKKSLKEILDKMEELGFKLKEE